MQHDALSFADELQRFQQRTSDPGYEALILLGTRQATTAALLIGTLSVQRVAFLLTEETQELPKEVAKLLGCSADDWLCPSGDHSTTLEVYQGLRTLLDQWCDLDRTKIAVDVTGGLKPMSLGLEKAAHVLDLQTIYVQSEYEQLPNGRSVPKPGTQRLEIPPDPYTVFGDLEAAEAERLFANYDYRDAQRIFHELARRVPPPARERYAAFTALAALYAAWDVLDFAEALGHAKKLLATPLDAISELAPHTARLQTQRDLLNTLTRVSGTVGQRDDTALATLADPAALLLLLGTLHTNALRRAAQGRYDFAALFRYRCLELMSQHRLATHGILSSSPQWKRLADYGPCNERFKEVQRTMGRKNARSLKSLRSVAMFDGYMLLAALDDPLVRGYPIKQIEERSKARNTSVLAHGYRLIDQAEYKSFAEVVESVLHRLFTHVLGQPRDDWERDVQHITPFNT